MHEAIVMSVVMMATGRLPRPRDNGTQMKFVKPRIRIDTPTKLMTAGSDESKSFM
jgi:hypothetical protein